MTTTTTRAASLAVLFSTAFSAVFSSVLAAQPVLQGRNLLMHNDGTAEATSRGDGLNIHKLTVLQRYPEEQCCGRQCLTCIYLRLQDQNPVTPENFYIEVRTGIPGGTNNPSGAPDMTAGGLLALFPMFLSGHGFVTDLTIGFPCVALPPGDFYVGVTFNPNPAWPANDGLSLHFSGTFGAAVGEQYRAGFTSRYGPGTAVGLGWTHNVTTGVGPTIATGNLSWFIGAGLQEDVVQQYAHNPGAFTGAATTGLNPNYGYAGIYPDNTARLDQVGWRVRSSLPVGSLCHLLLGPCFPTPIPIPWGLLCLDPIIVVAQPTLPGVSCETNMSEAVFGPWACVNCTFDICAQAATIDLVTFTIVLSTACVTDM